MDSGDLHRLMTALEVPAIAFLGLAGIDVDKRIPLRTPLPVALATHTMRRLAFEVDNHFGFFHTAFHGNGVSLAIELHANCFSSLVERKRWAFTEFLTMLSLSDIEELHIQVCNWEAHQEILLHLAAHMPAVSTLLIRVKHHPRIRRSEKEEDRCHKALAQMVTRVLESDNPVLFPNLVHLDLIVRTVVPLAFFELVACALARRDHWQDGRRLRRLRVGIDESPSPRQPRYVWPDYRQTGILDHVDSADNSDDADEQGMGWGRWKDCVERADHGYWRE